jgi:hypothetical protein
MSIFDDKAIEAAYKEFLKTDSPHVLGDLIEALNAAEASLRDRGKLPEVYFDRADRKPKSPIDGKETR